MTFLSGHKMNMFAMLIAFSIFHTSNSFVINRQANAASFRRETSQMQMNVVDSSSTLLTLATPTFSTSMSSTSLSNAAPEIMGDASHISDFINFFRSRLSPVALHVLIISSRMFCISSDFLPDHNILPSEIIYQSIMLTVASAGAFKALKDSSGNSQGFTMQDRRCYVSLFRPAGLSWAQFKHISESGAFQWIQVSPGSAVSSSESEDFLYWLQNGDLEVYSTGSMIQSFSYKSKSRLFGNLRFPVTGSTRKNLNSKASNSFLQASNMQMAFRAGSEGATVLRIDTIKLKQLMHRDSAVNAGVRRMLLQGLKANMATLMFSTQHP
mmetsp:Transcript_32925/g.49710  ORF Transcript_32925/g.49710 Transcript_32925/m.49710 type:complete len:325 (-) Transcript_32925:167-1141(-)